MSRVDACGHVLETTRTPFFVGFNRRFDPSHRALFDAIRAGEIGALEMLVLSSRDPEISPPDYVAAMPYGIFYDTMIHDFDMVRWLTGDEPIEIVARTACMLDTATNPHRDPDTAMVMLKMASGALVHVNSSFRAVYGYDQRIEAFGANGMLISRNRQPTTLERYSADGIREDPLLYFFIDRYAESYARELNDFVAALDEKRAPSIGFTDGRRARFPASRRDHAVFIEASAPTPNSAGACRGAIRRRPTTTRMTPTAAIISAISTEAYADA
jgi:myo-inositol 2-dehydrogenase/D-chiro-inositol 1-dehydrogenase